MAYAINPSPIPCVPITNSADTFPVHRIYCVGRNYAAHAREMGHDPARTPPVFFMKPADAIVPTGATVAYPSRTKNLQHEVELVVAIGETGRDIPAAKALEHVFGYGVGIDLTRRDLQLEAKESRGTWDTAKGFDQSAPISALHRAVVGSNLDFPGFVFSGIEPGYTESPYVVFAVLRRDDMAKIILDYPSLGSKVLVKLVSMLSARLRHTSAKLLQLMEKY